MSILNITVVTVRLALYCYVMALFSSLERLLVEEQIALIVHEPLFTTLTRQEVVTESKKGGDGGRLRRLQCLF